MTLLDDSDIDGVVAYVQGYVFLPSERIQEIVEKLLEEQYISVVTLGEGWDCYFHTDKVTRDLLDDDIHYRRNYGADDPSSHLNEKEKD